MRKYRWGKVGKFEGVVLRELRCLSDPRATYWSAPLASVFKAERGDRWIVELWPAPNTYERHAVHNLREGMRLCKMLVLLEHRNV
jgi:hypothetical protein